jgi:hypothetical protein
VFEPKRVMWVSLDIGMPNHSREKFSHHPLDRQDANRNLKSGVRNELVVCVAPPYNFIYYRLLSVIWGVFRFS